MKLPSSTTTPIKNQGNTGANLNKFLSQPNSAKNTAPKSNFSSETRLLNQMKERNLQNSYAFQIKFSDKERTVFFPKDEVEQLAHDIGIDIEHDKRKHIWFLQQALLSELPFGWIKEKDFNGKIVYQNFLTKSVSHIHPNIHKLRIAFNEIIKSEIIKESIKDNSIKTMNNYEKKLIKMQLDSLSISEKNRIAKKIRLQLQKDESKVSGELTKQIIVWLREKDGKFGINQNIEFIHDGKNMLQFKAILDIVEKSKSHAKLLTNPNNNNQELISKAIYKANQWYSEKIPLNSLSCPASIENSESYQFVNIENVLKNALLLEIKIDSEPFLLWVARIFTALELPPFWRYLSPAENEPFCYYNLEFDVFCNEHPGIEYFKTYLENVRANVKNSEFIHSSLKGQDFYDALLRDNEGNSQIDTKFETKYTNSAEKFDPNKTRKNEKTIKDVKVTDLEILEIARECSLDIEKEPLMLIIVEDIFKEIKKESDELWELRIPENGPPYWYSVKSKLSLKDFPFVDEFKSAIAEFQNKNSNLTQTELIKEFKKPKSELEEKLHEMSKKLVSQIVHKKLCDSLNIEIANSPTEEFSVKNICEIVGKQITKEEIMDLLFACPFELAKEKSIKDNDIPNIQINEIKSESEKSEISNNNTIDLGYIKRNRISSFTTDVNEKRKLMKTPQNNNQTYGNRDINMVFFIYQKI